MSCRVRSLALLALGLVAVGACSGNGTTTDDGLHLVEGFSVEVVATGLDGPTQIAPDGQGGFVVAQLAGGESDGVGEVVRLDPAVTSGHEVLLSGLDKPTGVAVVDGELWVMESDRLTRGPLDDPSSREVVVDDLPSNGRSEGTLTPLAGGELLYETSGDQDGPEAAPGSGVLWRVGADGRSAAIATGLKNAYAHVVDADGRLWVTEIADGRFDGAPAQDELVEVVADAGDDPVDFGWPVCVGDRVPVAENGGTAATCAATPPSHALFEPGATPTSVAVAPWDVDTLVVALWNQGRVVTVPRSDEGAPHTGDDLLVGLDHPQHLLAIGERLLVVDFTGGRVLAVGPRDDR